jgi:hypothetical protein
MGCFLFWGGGEKPISRGLKPDFVEMVDVRAEARTYLRGNGNGPGLKPLCVRILSWG